MAGETYRHSGKVGPFAWQALILATALTAAVLGFLYVLGLAWVPDIRLAFLLTAVTGLGVGGAVGYTARASKVRNSKVVTTFATIGALGTLYVAWACDAYTRFQGDAPMMWTPQELIAYIQIFYEEGFWGIGERGITWTGGWLVAVWATEAFVVIAIALATAWGAYGQAPFCEDCIRWTDATEDHYQVLAPGGDVHALTQLCEGEVSVLTTFEKRPDNCMKYISISTAKCPECTDSNFITVKSAQVTIDKNGNPVTNAQVLVENLRLTSDRFEELQAAAASLPVGRLKPDVDATSTDGIG